MTYFEQSFNNELEKTGIVGAGVILPLLFSAHKAKFPKTMQLKPQKPLTGLYGLEKAQPVKKEFLKNLFTPKTYQ